MQTIFDWIAVAMFGGIAILFVNRSIGPARRGDHILLYVPAAIGCAAANYFGNRGITVVAVGLILVTAGYVLIALKPGRSSRGDS